MTYFKLLRMQRRLTQKQLATILKCHPNILSRIECGWLSKPPRGLEERLSRFFGDEWGWAELMAEVPDPTAERTAGGQTGADR